MFKPSKHCNPHTPPHARDEVIDNNTHIGTCRVCGGQRQYPANRPGLFSGTYAPDAHTENLGRIESTNRVLFSPPKQRRLNGGQGRYGAGNSYKV